MKRLLIAVLCLCCLAPACQRDDAFATITEMGTVQGSDILGDNGNRYHIIEQSWKGSLDTLGRVFFKADVLQTLGGNEFGIRLGGISIPRILEAEPAGASVPAGDPVRVDGAWFSGGYLNMAVGWFARQGSSFRHSFRLLYDASSSPVRLVFIHEGNGENYGALPERETLTEQAVFCIPEEPFLPKSGQIEISWNGYRTEDGSLLPQSETYTHTGTIVR